MILFYLSIYLSSPIFGGQIGVFLVFFLKWGEKLLNGEKLGYVGFFPQFGGFPTVDVFKGFNFPFRPKSSSRVCRYLVVHSCVPHFSG